MSATQKRSGRPATGITKVKPGITLDAKLVSKAKKSAFREGMSFSQYVERAVDNYFSNKTAE